MYVCMWTSGRVAATGQKKTRTILCELDTLHATFPVFDVPRVSPTSSASLDESFVVDGTSVARCVHMYHSGGETFLGRIGSFLAPFHA